MNATPLDLLIEVHKALAHPVRVRILAMLRGRRAVRLPAQRGDRPGAVDDLGAPRRAQGRRAGGRAQDRPLGALPARRRGTPPRRRSRRCGRRSPATRSVGEDAVLLPRITELPVEAICRPDFDLASLRAVCCPVPRQRRRPHDRARRRQAVVPRPLADAVDLRRHGGRRWPRVPRPRRRRLLEPLPGRHDQHPDRDRPDPDDVPAARQGALRGAGRRLPQLEGARPVAAAELGDRADPDVRPGRSSSCAATPSTWSG